MSEYRSSSRDPRRDYGDRYDRDPYSPQPGIRRSSNGSGARPSTSRPAGGSSSGSRPASRPQGTRQGSNPPPRSRASGPQSARPQPSRSGGQRSAQYRPGPRRRRRRRGVKPRFFVILGIVILLIVALVLLVRGSIGGGDDVTPMATPTLSPQGGALGNVTIGSNTPDPNAPQTAAPPAGQGAQEEEEKDNVPEISAEDQVQLSAEQLHINSSLPAEWLNVLLLGTDERWLDQPARTDTMIIASINTDTGEVKLTSLMRDTAVDFYDLPKNSGTYRINAANYFGGPLYAVKTVNECLEMNIQYYVSVNFYGFQRIAQALGGIDVDITEAEMNEINKKQVEQAVVAATVGVDEPDQENVLLTTYGPNTHLNGRQTLAYARVRSIDSDFARTERQRTVITKLTEKLRGKSAAEILALLASLSGNVSTNMDLETVGRLAIQVLSSDLTGIETLHLPKNGTYTLERRNNQEMFYDTDWQENALQLYNFIYG